MHPVTVVTGLGWQSRCVLLAAVLFFLHAQSGSTIINNNNTGNCLSPNGSVLSNVNNALPRFSHLLPLPSMSVDDDLDGTLTPDNIHESPSDVGHPVTEPTSLSGTILNNMREKEILDFKSISDFKVVIFLKYIVCWHLQMK